MTNAQDSEARRDVTNAGVTSSGTAGSSERVATDGASGHFGTTRRLSTKKGAVIAAAGIGGAALLLYRNPDLRRVVGDLCMDREVQDACRSAWKVITEKWYQYDGPTALAHAILR